MNSLTITNRTLAKAWLSIINTILWKRRSQTPWTKHRNILTLQLPNSSTLPIWFMISTTGQSVPPKFLFFHEVSGNFQQYNFGRGAENDAVIANAQDGSGFNNANFMTPPDGQNGRMRIYLWKSDRPYRDGSFEAGVVIHELSHGLSSRLTGGLEDAGCLGWGEAGGLGEGWGDFLATTIRSNKIYYLGRKPGQGSQKIRLLCGKSRNSCRDVQTLMVNQDAVVNPTTFETLNKPGYEGVHAIGEIWAKILWVVSQKLINKHGYSDDLYPPAPLEDGSIRHGNFYCTDLAGRLVPKHGNTLMVQ